MVRVDRPVFRQGQIDSRLGQKPLWIGVDKPAGSIYNRFIMSKSVTKAFKVDGEAWANFVKAAESYGATPAELLRELVRHVDAAVRGIRSGRIRSFDGDVAQLLRAEFPQLSSFRLRTMAEILMQAAELAVDAEGTKKEERGSPPSSRP